jgi:hypothetical protein
MLSNVTKLAPPVPVAFGGRMQLPHAVPPPPSAPAVFASSHVVHVVCVALSPHAVSNAVIADDVQTSWCSLTVVHVLDV